MRLGSDLAVKYGVCVEFFEGENMKYVDANTSVQKSNGLAMFSDFTTYAGRQVKEQFIFMDYIPGDTLESAWSSLTWVECVEIGAQAYAAIGDIRSLSAPDYLGGVNRHRLVDGIFMTEPLDEAICGPFGDEDPLNEGMIRPIRQLPDEPHTNLIRSMVAQLLTGHRTVFTHGDIQARNIMV